MPRFSAAVVSASAFLVFCVWSVLFGFRSDRTPSETIPAWSPYQCVLPAGTCLSDLFETQLVRGHLVAAGLSETELEPSRLMQAVRQLDRGALKESVCARLRGSVGDVWVYSARLSLRARLLHWQTICGHPDGMALLGRHNGWPVWEMREITSSSAQPLFFTFADGMLFASMGSGPDGVFDLLDQFDGLIP